MSGASAPSPESGLWRPLALALVCLLGGVSFRFGGYDPWAGLALEWGAALLVLFVVTRTLWTGGAGESPERRRAAYRAWRSLSFWVRHPDLAAVSRLMTLSRFPARRSITEIEIYLPGSDDEAAIRLDPAREQFVVGRRFPRTGIALPVLLLAAWIALSLVPLTRTLLETLSPEAGRVRAEAAGLLETTPDAPAPWTLAPFPTFEGLWLWIAAVGLFYVAFRVARAPGGASRLALLLLILGALSGAVGIAGWLSDLKEVYGRTSEAIRAHGGFGNPNHFAAFQSMLLLVGLGFLGYFQDRHADPDPRTTAGRARPRPHQAWNDRGLVSIAGLGVVVLALGLLLSLSRSGISFALVGAATYVLMTRGPAGAKGLGKRPHRVLWMLALTVAALAVWLGTEPVVERFTKLGEQWEREGTRVQVWKDSLPAVGTFWLTGSGLGSFRYVNTRFRTFGGRIFYSWAHNDYLQLLIELGVPGFLMFGWIAVSIVRAGLRARESLRAHPALRTLHAGYAGALVAIALHSLTDFGMHIPANLALAAIVVGALVGMRPTESEEA